MTRSLSLTLLVLVASCGGDEPATDMMPSTPLDCFIGDRGAAPELQLVYRTVDGQMAPFVDGADIPLILPPQGGKVFLIGVRARNVDGCGLRISASMRDACTGRILGRDGRPIFLTADAEGWGIPRQPRELSDYANVPACPSFAALRDVDNEPYQVELSITDRDGRTAAVTTTVVPVCAEAQFFDQCTCECDADYILGGGCALPPDGDDPPGTCPAETP